MSVEKRRERKRKLTTVIVAVCAVLLFLPIPATIKDGGTKTFTALLYRVVIWHRLDLSCEGGYKTGVELQLLPDNFKSLDEF